MGIDDRLAGKAKEFEGKATGDATREAEGELDQAKGDAKDAAGKLKDAAGNLIGHAKDELDKRRPENAAKDERR